MRKILLLLGLLMAAALSLRGSAAVATPLSGVATIAAGPFHVCALAVDGGVKCWGLNDYGALGDGTQTDRFHPADTVGLQGGVTAIAAGGVLGRSCAVMGKGSLKCWGYNDLGQLGVGNEIVQCPEPVGSGWSNCRMTPTDVIGLMGGVAAVAAGDDHTCAVTSTGGVKCWGLNQLGQVGDGTTIARTTPVDVVGLASGVAAVALGGDQSCALIVEGTVKCWGKIGWELADDTDERCSDSFGQLVPCSITPLDICQTYDAVAERCKEPLSGVTGLTVGTSYACALMENSTVKCWGSNGGNLGDGGRCGSRCRPMEVCADATCSASLSGVVAVDAGHHTHTCALIATGGVKCWGENFAGELGDGTTTERTTPVDVCQVYDAAAQQCAEALSGITALAAGFAYTCAVASPGGVTCWGKGCCLGTGTPAPAITPQPVPEDVLVKKSPEPTATPTRPPPQVGNGDVNCDGAATSVDVILVQQRIAGLLRPPLSVCHLGGDANLDGRVTALDAALILQYVAGLIDRLPVTDAAVPAPPVHILPVQPQ